MAEAPTEFHEHIEHAEHAAHSGDSMLSKVSMTIALLAVVAATIGSLETIETAQTISAKNAAVLLQNKATDNWNFFQAKSLKKNMYEIAADSNPARAEDYTKQAKRYDSEQKDIQKDARRLEEDSEAKLKAAEHHEHRHHVLTIAVTLLHVSIAIATISIITRGKRWPWFGAMGLGLIGIVTAASAYLH